MHTHTHTHTANQASIRNNAEKINENIDSDTVRGGRDCRTDPLPCGMFSPHASSHCLSHHPTPCPTQRATRMQRYAEIGLPHKMGTSENSNHRPKTGAKLRCFTIRFARFCWLPLLLPLLPTFAKPVRLRAIRLHRQSLTDNSVGWGGGSMAARRASLNPLKIVSLDWKVQSFSAQQCLGAPAARHVS